jgi:beta-glucanase (GH16 family)
MQQQYLHVKSGFYKAIITAVVTTITFAIVAMTLPFSDPLRLQGSNENHSPSLFYDDFSQGIQPSLWQVATWQEHEAQTGTERCFVKDGYLHLVFINDPEKGYLNAAIQTVDEFLYGKWEVRAKPTPVPGVLNSIYTIDWNNRHDNTSESNGTKQEVDIEFLTSSFGPDTGEVHIAVHAHGKKSFNSNPDLKLPFNPSDDFNTWGFEILPDRINWFVNDQPLHTYIFSQYDIVIDAPYQFKMNVWTDSHWIKGPPEAGKECVYLVDWIRFTPAD